MSYEEYNDLFIKCQKTGIYHIFTFDIINSKQISKKERYIVQKKLIELANLMYKELLNEQTKKNKNILVFEDGFSYFSENKIPISFGAKIEPFIIGDMFAITIYRNSISKEEILAIFKKYKNILNLNYDFHYADGYYETNNWEEADKKYFRGLVCSYYKNYIKQIIK